MSPRIDQFCETMRFNLNGMEAQVEQARADIGKAQKDGAAAFDLKITEARNAVDAQRAQAEAAGMKVRHWIAARTEAGEAVIQGWKDRFDTANLELHADNAEAGARASVIIAQAALADATLATYEAIAARQHATADAK